MRVARRPVSRFLPSDPQDLERGEGISGHSKSPTAHAPADVFGFSPHP